MTSKPSVPEHLQKILDAFDFSDAPLPRQAFEAAREHRDEIIPKLLKAFKNEIETIEDRREFHSWLPIISLFLLVEFRAKETLPLVFQSLHFSRQAIDDLYGDMLTEDMPGILYYLGIEPEMLDALVRNEKVDPFVRWEALICFYYFVRDGRLGKDELIDRFQTWLKDTIDTEDPDMSTALVHELASCGAESALPLIEQAYAKDLVDTFLMGKLSDLQEELRTDEISMEQKFERLGDYTDALAEVEGWHSFQPKKPKPPKRKHSSKSIGSQSLLNEPPDRRQQKIGRNDPCPCGSGKKYKKCCMK